MISDMRDICGQAVPKRVMEIAAAGGHSVLMIGPAGIGRGVFARRLPGILPEMMPEEIEATTGVYRNAGLLRDPDQVVRDRPFRAPHYTCSSRALCGGSLLDPKPGEMSLANSGVLFLDDLQCWDRQQLIDLATSWKGPYKLPYPSDFLLVATMDPCPCGRRGVQELFDRCRCSAEEIRAYMDRVLKDPIGRLFDLRIEVRSIDLRDRDPSGETSEAIRSRVVKAREFAGREDRSLVFPDALRAIPLGLFEQMGITRVARTIANLEGSSEIKLCHVSEAIQYRIAGH
jgi:magnesium chelatase family protein